MERWVIECFTDLKDLYLRIRAHQTQILQDDDVCELFAIIERSCKALSTLLSTFVGIHRVGGGMALRPHHF